MKIAQFTHFLSLCWKYNAVSYPILTSLSFGF